MKLYHGSNIAVPNPEILEADRKLDFGDGFYLTSSLEQAERWARKTAGRRGNGKPVISVYEFEDAADLKIRRFEKANRQWLLFVAAHRDGTAPGDNCDIIIGPVANDQTMPVLKLFFARIYTVSETIRRLLPQTLKDQYTFKTRKALSRLTFVEAIEK